MIWIVKVTSGWMMWLIYKAHTHIHTVAHKTRIIMATLMMMTKWNRKMCIKHIWNYVCMNRMYDSTNAACTPWAIACFWIMKSKQTISHRSSGALCIFCDIMLVCCAGLCYSYTESLVFMHRKFNKIRRKIASTEREKKQGKLRKLPSKNVKIIK